MIVWNPHHLFTVDGPCSLLVNLVCWEFLHQHRNLIQDCESWCSKVSGKSSMEAVDKSENILLQASNSVLQVPRLKQGKFPISGWQLCAFLFLSPFLSTFFCSTFNSSFLPSLLSFPYTWKSALLGENPQKLSPTFLLGIHRKLYLSNIIYQHLFDLLWQKIQKRINISHRYVYLKQVGYIQQLEHCKLTILQHNTGILKRREEKQCLLYSPWPPWLAFATPSLELTAGLGWVWDSLAGCPSLNLF